MHEAQKRSKMHSDYYTLRRFSDNNIFNRNYTFKAPKD